MSDIAAKLASLGPEMALGIGACLCLLVGLWPSARVRRWPALIAAAALLAAAVLAYASCFSPAYADPTGTVGFSLTLPTYIKLAVAGMGLLLLLVAANLPEQAPQIQRAESAPSGQWVDPGLIFRGEFFAFFLLSLAGVMLVAEADDLVWLFLALELVSLPTYVMVAVSRPQPAAQEAAVKYFFLGALAVAVFLYGFALIYGATGFTRFDDIRRFIAAAGPANLPPMLLTGLVLAVVGVSFKIAAVPMHFYAADVYQGAAVPVTAFLAFVPKTAGFVALAIILGLADPTGRGALPDTLAAAVWIIAALTMTVGNVLGLLQTSVKRVLAYSSIAHSGYMLVGLLAGARVDAAAPTALGNGLAAVLFYLVAYGLATLAAFAVLGCLRSHGRDADSYDDIAGLARQHPGLGTTMLLAVLSLIGLPPLVGFLGKIYLFGSAIEAGYLGLVIIAVLNSAVSAAYYLRIASACYFAPPPEAMAELPVPARRIGAMLAALLTLLLGVVGGPLVDAARLAARPQPLADKPIIVEDASPPAPEVAVSRR